MKQIKRTVLEGESPTLSSHYNGNESNLYVKKNRDLQIYGKG